MTIKETKEVVVVVYKGCGFYEMSLNERRSFLLILYDIFDKLSQDDEQPEERNL